MVSDANKVVSKPLDPPLSALGTRELEVVLCFLAGDRVGEIAHFVQASQSTVRRALKSATGALGCATTDDLRTRFQRFSAA